jgi:integrase/recombinase XerD
MNLTKAIDGYMIGALADGFSPLTLEVYKSALLTLAKYIGDKEIDTITTEDLKGFMSFLRSDYIPRRGNGRTEPLSTASFHRYWKAIRSFYKWAEAELGCGRPDAPLKMPHFTNREIVPLSEEEIKKLIKACDATLIRPSDREPYEIHRHCAIRDKAMVLVLLDTGLRAGELGRLTIRDVNLENGEVYVLPHHVRKTRPRTVYLGKIARKALWRYLSDRGEVLPNDPLFATTDGRSVDPATILKIVRRIGERAGVSAVHPHKFRHTFAVQYLRNGGDVFTLQRLLGHSTLEMVRRYLALADADDAEAHRKASPVDRWKL